LHQFDGDGSRNGYLLGSVSTDQAAWDNRDQFTLQWRLRASEAFVVYARIQTRDGLRYLRYDTRSGDSLANPRGTVIHHGLGRGARNDQWQTWTRDLAADLADAQPDNPLVAVQGFLVRGSLRIDDVRLFGNARSLTLPAPEPDSQPIPEPELTTSEPDFEPIVQNTAPVAGFSSRAIGDANALSIEFDASGSFDDKAVIAHEWNFGDATTGSGEVVTHSYSNPGVYQVVLTAYDLEGLSSTATANVEVIGDEDDSGNGTDVTRAEAARLLTQATFGTTDAGIAEVQELGIEG